MQPDASALLEAASNQVPNDTTFLAGFRGKVKRKLILLDINTHRRSKIGIHKIRSGQ